MSTTTKTNTRTRTATKTERTRTAQAQKTKQDRAQATAVAKFHEARQAYDGTAAEVQDALTRSARNGVTVGRAALALVKVAGSERKAAEAAGLPRSTFKEYVSIGKSLPVSRQSVGTVSNKDVETVRGHLARRSAAKSSGSKGSKGSQGSKGSRAQSGAKGLPKTREAAIAAASDLYVAVQKIDWRSGDSAERERDELVEALMAAVEYVQGR